MTNALDKAHAKYSNICILGDLNFDYLDVSKSGPLRDLCDQFDLDQLIKQPTNLTIHGQSLIDVILCSDASVCKASGVRNNGLSDSHGLVYVIMKFQANRLPPRTVTYRSYKHFNEESYTAYL